MGKIRLYTNRELSEKLGIKLAKWKRWSREFLPPDPLGGMQSGYARHYYFSDAFEVMLGGHLVRDLHFGVPEARRIIEDLKNWMSEKGFYQQEEKEAGEITDIEKTVRKYIIFIRRLDSLKDKRPHFSYRIKGILSDQVIQDAGETIKEERYSETIIQPAKKECGHSGTIPERILHVTSLYRDFVEKLRSD